jgi:hypothetical protein
MASLPAEQADRLRSILQANEQLITEAMAEISEELDEDKLAQIHHHWNEHRMYCA